MHCPGWREHSKVVQGFNEVPEVKIYYIENQQKGEGQENVSDFGG